MTLSELALELGVSPASISIVRQGRPGVSPATRRRIQLALEENGYTYIPYAPAHTAPRSHATPTRYIRLMKYSHTSLLTDKNEGFVDAIIDAIDAIARSQGYTLALTSVCRDEYATVLHDMATSNCLGLLVIATEMDREEIEQLKTIPLPIVVLDTDHPNLPFSSVSMNNRDLAYHAVSQLSVLGEVGYLCSRIRTGNFIARRNGYSEAVLDLELPYSADMIFELTPSLSGAYEDMDHLLSQGRAVPKAFFADNDVIAIGAMRALKQHGYQIPLDVSIIGVDNTMLSQISSPTLSSTQISCATLGELAIHLLLDQINSPTDEQTHIRIGSRLILRESTAL